MLEKQIERVVPAVLYTVIAGAAFMAATGCGGEEMLPPCGEGTHEGSECVATTTTAEGAKFLEADAVSDPSDSTSTLIIISYYLSVPACVYYKFRYNHAESWTVGSSTGKYSGGFATFGVSPATRVYWRLEARNDSDEIVDSREGELTTPAK